jgi:hypothetical protein
MSMFRSSILRLMPPQLYERVGKWTHEPQSNFNHKKHFSNAFARTFIFSIILFQKYKNIFTFLHTQSKSKNTFTAFYKLHISLVYLSRIIFTLLHCYYFILFYLYSHLVLDNHSVELGIQDKEIVLHVAWRRTVRAFLTVPWEFDIKPSVPSWGKFTLAITLCTRSPDELAPCLVSSRLFSGAVTGEQIKAFTTASFIERRLFIDMRSCSCAMKSPKLGEVTPLWVFSLF